MDEQERIQVDQGQQRQWFKGRFWFEKNRIQVRYFGVCFLIFLGGLKGADLGFFRGSPDSARERHVWRLGFISMFFECSWCEREIKRHY